MTQRHNASLLIALPPDQTQLSKAQKSFNTLVQKIEKRRSELLRWQSAVQQIQKKILEDFVPLEKTHLAAQVDLVRALDAAFGGAGLTKTERATLKKVICDLAEQILEMDGTDAALKEIYNRHSPVDYETGEARAASQLKDVMEDVFGLDLGADQNFNSPADLMEELGAHMEQIKQRERAWQEKRQTRKKTPKQLAREQAVKAEADQASQSLREVYRKLVSALHPDREPDAQERERKTGLMQRVNQAYDKGDLLQLLQLQLELEHIDPQAMASLSESRLKHFNKILKEQLEELDLEISRLEMPLRHQINLVESVKLAPEQFMSLLNRDIARLKNDTNQVKQQLSLPKNLPLFKRWIKDQGLILKAKNRYGGGFDFF